MTYNDCLAHPYQIYSKKVNRNVLDFTLKSGVNFNNVTVNHSNLSTNPEINDLDELFNLRFGVEVELFLPFKKNKWSTIFESTYRNYKSTVKKGEHMTMAEYKSIEFSMGVRYYMYLNKSSKLFFNLLMLNDRPFESSQVTINVPRPFTPPRVEILPIETRLNFGIGIGYKLVDRLSFEIRYHTPRQILGSYVLWDGEHQSISGIIGFTVF